MKRKHLSYANVMSSIAVFLVLGGASALAATHLASNSVGTKQLRNNAVTAGKIANGAVSTSKLAKASVSVEKLATNAVGTTNVLDKAISGPKLAAGVVTSSKLGPITVRESAKTKVEAGKQGVVTSACNAGEVLLSSGYAWDEQKPALSVESSSRTANTASVVATNGEAAAHNIVVQAVCLAP